MEKRMVMQFSASFSASKELDDTRTIGLLRVCYTGENRNKTYISKEAIERAIPTMFNRPIVCNYDRENDTIGGHDMVVASDDDGNMFFVNLTDGIGVVPESASYYFEEVEEDDGTVHEYFVTEAILWKRSAVYRKIERDGVESHSMEIIVKDGETIDGIYHINDFVFDAFCLLGSDVTPCFESSALRIFNAEEYKTQFDTLMSTMRKEFAKLDADIQSEQSLKGGEKLLNLSSEKTSILEKYGLTIEQVSDDVEKLKKMNLEKFEKLCIATVEKFADDEADTDTGSETETETDGSETTDGSDESGESGTDDSSSGTDDGNDTEEGESTGGEDSGDDSSEEDDGDDDTIPAKKNTDYSLMAGQLIDSLRKAVWDLGHDVIEDEWGSWEMPWYSYVDCSVEDGEVYCLDKKDDYSLCGFKYTMNGDNVEIDVESKTKKKYQIVDFDEGEANEGGTASFAALYESISQSLDRSDALKELAEFKAKTEQAARDAEVEKVFAQFASLEGIEAFENLKANSGTMTAAEVKHECFAIRGEFGTPTQFSMNTQPSRIPIEKQSTDEQVDKPYGGFFEKYPPRF